MQYTAVILDYVLRKANTLILSSWLCLSVCLSCDFPHSSIMAQLHNANL